jgi:hypothetical protein
MFPPWIKKYPYRRNHLSFIDSVINIIDENKNGKYVCLFL